MSSITASLVIQFGGTASASDILTAEIDSRSDGYNSGVTSFVPGDSPAFLVFASPGLSLSFKTSAGVIQSLGSGQLDIVEFVTFAESKEASLQKLPSGGVNILAVSGNASGLQVIGDKLVAAEVCTAVVRVSYSALFKAYRLTGAPSSVGGESSFPVVIVVIGSK